MFNKIQVFFLVFVLLKSSTQSSHYNACSKFKPDAETINIKRYLMPLKYNDISTAISVNLKEISSKFDDLCPSESNNSHINTDFEDFTDKLIELNWVIQFQHSSKCIRIELDLGKNLTNLKRKLDSDYYMFSYREFSQSNIYLNRNPIKESDNILVINNVHKNPYIVCVTFLKKQFNDDKNKTCDEYKDLLKEDVRLQDIDLCVDISLHSELHDIMNPHHLKDMHSLVFSIFIIILLVISLATIAISKYFIDRPKRKHMLNDLRGFIKEKNGIDSDTESDPEVILDEFLERREEAEDSELESLIEDASNRYEYKPHRMSSILEEEHNYQEDSVKHLLDDKPWNNDNDSENKIKVIFASN